MRLLSAATLCVPAEKGIVCSFGSDGSCVRCVPGAGDTVTFQMELHLLIVFVTQLHVVPADEGNLDVYINLETIGAYSPELVLAIESTQFRDKVIRSMSSVNVQRAAH